MLKPVLAASIILGSVSLASAMPVAPVATGTAPQVEKTAVIVKKVIRRRPPVRHMVVKKTIIRR